MLATSGSSVSFADQLADRFDPPAWEPADRPPLQPHQRPPDGDWDLWLLEGGRGSGKTEACARYFAAYMRAHPGARGRIIAPTLGDAVEACVQGPSGLLAMDPEIRWLPSAPGGARLEWSNGSEAIVRGTPSPVDVERLRAGGNRELDWWEEMAANTHLKDAWDQAQFGLRKADGGATHVHSIASTTPRATPAYRAIRALPGVVRTHGTIDDNPYLSEEWRAKQKARYAGTRIGRQELGGELLEDVQGALWTAQTLESGRVARLEGETARELVARLELVVVVTAIDPAATSTAAADDTGIIVAGLGADGDGYVLADRTCHLEPNGWGHRALVAHREFLGDRVVGEVNNGGEMVDHVIATVATANGEVVPFRPVRASRGKQTRAQPVAALYEQGRVHHVGGLPELEDQQTTWVPEDAKSPDRLDALVWAITDLMLADEEREQVVEFYEPVRIGPRW